MYPDITPSKGVEHASKLRELFGLRLFPLDGNLDVSQALPGYELRLFWQSIGRSWKRKVNYGLDAEFRQP